FAPVSLLAGGYVNLMRSVPLVLVIFWFYFLVPFIGQWVTGRLAADPSRRVRLLARDFHPVRGRVFRGNHARRNPVDPARSSRRRASAGNDLPAGDGLHRAAAGVP